MAPLYVNITLSEKLEVHNVSQCYQRKTKPQPQATRTHACTHARTYACTTVLRPSWILSGTTRVSRHQKGKTNLDLLEQEIVSGSGISWAICKSAPWPRHITTPASHHSVFLQAECPSCNPTNSGKALKTQAQKHMVKFGSAVFKLYEKTERQTNKQTDWLTDILTTILCTPPWESNYVITQKNN